MQLKSLLEIFHYKKCRKVKWGYWTEGPSLFYHINLCSWQYDNNGIMGRRYNLINLGFNKGPANESYLIACGRSAWEWWAWWHLRPGWRPPLKERRSPKEPQTQKEDPAPATKTVGFNFTIQLSLSSHYYTYQISTNKEFILY